MNWLTELVTDQNPHIGLARFLHLHTSVPVCDVNAAVASRPASLYIARIEDEHLGEALSDHAYLDATAGVLQRNGDR